jgi:hypothetical protein
MHVEILADTPSQRKGDKVHLAADVCRTLIALGFAREVPPAPPEPATVSWGVKFDSYGGPMLIGNCSRGCALYRFLGRPEFVHKNHFQHACGAMPVPVPKEVIEQYRKAYAGAAPSATGDDQKMLNARQGPDVADRNADVAFAKLYGRPRRW